MRFRILALALALSCGFTALAEAKNKPAVTRTKARKFKAPKNRMAKAHRVKPSKHKARR